MKNKILSFVLAVCLIVPCMLALTACGKDDDPKESAKVMTVSLNPAIEFVLDKDDKVVSVNAVNDDGNFIVGHATFTGLSADDAVDLFLQVSKESGFVLENSTEDFKIEISGETANKLYEKVSKSARDYLSESNITLNISFEKISKEDIKSMVEECMKELSSTELNKLSEEELLSLLEKSRKETANFFSQELKELFYQSRAQEIIDAKCEKIQALISALSLSEEYAEVVGAFETAYSAYTSALTTFKTQYQDIYMNGEKAYQIAMQAYVDAKKAFLDARLEGVSDLTSYEQALKAAKDALYGNIEESIAGAKKEAENALAQYKTALDGAISNLDDALNEVFNSLFGFIDMSQIETHLNNTINGFKNHFNDQFSSHIENKYWSKLNPNK